MNTDDLSRILDDATVIHLQPDDVLVFSNAGELGAETEDIERLAAIFGDRKVVVFDGPVDIQRLRDIAPCAACEERKREADAATEQWKQEFRARHGMARAINANDFESTAPEEAAAKELEAELRRAIKYSE